MNGIPCEKCGWSETPHEFPALYPQCRHKYVPAKHLKEATDDRDGQGDSSPENARGVL
jgi:hypothetical protein